MRSIRSRRRLLLGLCSALALAAVGCEYHYVHVGNWGSQESYELTSSHGAAFTAGMTLDVSTSSGSISVTGTDAPDCRVTATITGYAPTAEEAQELAERTVIQLNQAGQSLQVFADIPETGNNRGVSVSYDVAVPRQANLVLSSAYGPVRADTIEGTVNAKTNSGSIEATDIYGTTLLDTAYGAISCVGVIGDDIVAHSGSGSIVATDIEGATRLETSFGSVTCKRSSGGALTLKSGSGTIAVSQATFTTCDASTSYGSVTVQDIQGDSIKCASGSGSIEVSAAEAPAMDLHTSYGRVNARDIATDDLRASSGSGSVDIACSPACPTDLAAEVKSSYGSVTFAAPPGFAGNVTLVSGYGTVETDLPVTVSGRVGDKKRIQGVIGQGGGKLDLQTGSGSVTLK